MPQKTISAKIESPYFNTEALVVFNKVLIEEVKRVLSDFEKIVFYVCDNHLMHALNCGRNYLPFSLSDKKIRFYTQKVDGIQTIIDRIVPLMYIVDPVIILEHKIIKETILESLKHNTVTNTSSLCT